MSDNDVKMTEAADSETPIKDAAAAAGAEEPKEPQEPATKSAVPSKGVKAEETDSDDASEDEVEKNNQEEEEFLDAAMEEVEEVDDTEAKKEQALAKKEAGNLKYKAKDYYDALDLYTEAINLDPECAAYYNNRAAARMMVNQLDSAILDCKKSIELDPSNIKVYIRYGGAALKRGLCDEAIKAYQAGLVRDPTNAVALKAVKEARLTKQRIETAQSKFKQGNVSNAYQLAAAALRTAPESWEAQLLTAECQNEKGNHQQAYSITTKLMRERQNDNRLILLRAKILYYEENFANAIRHLSQIMRGDPDNSDAAKELKKIKKLERLKKSGNDAFSGRNYSKAVEDYTAALAIDPKHKSFCSKLYCNRAAALLRLGKNKEALADCNEAIERNDEYGKAYMRRAETLRAIGDKESLERAIFDYDKAEKLVGGSREIKQKIRETKTELKKAKRKDYYKILELEHREHSSEAQIKKAYKKAALKWHPDRHSQKTDKQKEEAEVMFKEVSEAYDVLSDPEKKAKWDQGYDLEEIEQGGGMHGHGMGVDPNEIFSMFFGGGMGGMGGMGGHGGGGHGFHFG